MIVFRVKNRLGDQLLKYAAAKALAKHHRTEVAADLWWVRETKKKDFRYYLPSLGFKTKIVDHSNLPYYDKSPGKQYDKKALFSKPDNIILGGLWYHHHYFDTIIDDMRQEVHKQPIPEGTVGIHVRRGDFVSIDNRVECTVDYVEEAVKVFPADEYIITTDDKKWCERKLSHIGKDVTIFSGKPVDDFRILRSCEKLIISASAFSWWAALLAGCPVVAPKHWFYRGKRKEKELPDHWITI